MEAVKFVREYRRMCKAQKDCDNCPIEEGGKKCAIMFDDWDEFYKDLDNCVEIVEQWSKEHPQRTRMDDLLERYPKAKVGKNGYPLICAEYIGYVEECDKGGDCKMCWNTPMEE